MKECNETCIPRFLVVCSYQPDTLTVRASFAVPGQGSADALEPDWAQSDRSARQRKFRMVGKDSLVVRDSAEAILSEVQEKSVGETSSLSQRQARKRLDRFEDTDFSENLIEDELARPSKYARLTNNRDDSQGECYHSRGTPMIRNSNTPFSLQTTPITREW